jgi:hypothetical protein
LPQVSLNSSNYSDLFFYPDANSHPSFITIANAQINSTSERFKLNLNRSLITQFKNYQVKVSLENDLGQRGPYIVNITVNNTQPKFLGKAEMSVIAKV